MERYDCKLSSLYSKYSVKSRVKHPSPQNGDRAASEKMSTIPQAGALTKSTHPSVPPKALPVAEHLGAQHLQRKWDDAFQHTKKTANTSGPSLLSCFRFIHSERSGEYRYDDRLISHSFLSWYNRYEEYRNIRLSKPILLFFMFYRQNSGMPCCFPDTNP